MSFDKLGKSIKEVNQVITPYHGSDDYPIRFISKLSKLSTNTRAILCRWLRYGFMEGVQAEVLPNGTVILTDWSSEVDGVIHELIDNGMALMDNGRVEVPFMMTMADQVDLGLACDGDHDDLLMGDGGLVYPSPMLMRVPSTKEITEEPCDDLIRSTASAIRRFRYYISGEVAQVSTNVRSLGIANAIVFKNPIDILVITRGRGLIAHRVIDPGRTVHRGLSALESYLMDGVDYAVLVHRYTYYEDHVETFNKIINRPYIRDSGFAIIPNEPDYMVFLKWPRANTLIAKSQSIMSRHALISNTINFILSTQ